MITLLEDLPNELLLDVFEYISLRDLYYSFCSLNRRFNHLVWSLNNLFIIIYKNEQLLFEIFAHKITHLVVHNVYDTIELKQFPNLRSLTIHCVNDNQLKQIRHEFMPNLVYLVISLSFITPSSTELTENIFSNRLPSLQYVDLGQIQAPFNSKWSVSPSLRSISIYCSEPIVIHEILISSPNLKRLQVKLGKPKQYITLPIIPLNHCLKHFILLDDYSILSLETINNILLYIPNVKQFVFQGICHGPFVNFAQILSNRLKYLSQFDCYIRQSPNNYENNDLETIREIHSCFNRIICTINYHGYRLFTTDR
jgi:hypothetical protein